MLISVECRSSIELRHSNILTQDSILVCPDFSLPFTMCTEGFAFGISAVRIQTESEQRPHVIAYGSRIFTDRASK